MRLLLRQLVDYFHLFFSFFFVREMFLMKGASSGGEPNPFPSQIAGRKRICDRRRPDVVSGSRRRCPEKRKRGGCAAWTSGEFDFDVFLRPPGVERMSFASSYPRHGPSGAANDAAACTYPHVFGVYTSSYSWRLLQVHLLSVHTIGGPASQFTYER